MNNDMVSIIVPVYKAENYIISTIESVAGQTYKDWELLLVDDCGGDSSVDLILAYMESHPEYRIRLIRQEKNAGAANARNRGLYEAAGRYIAFLDADDLWYPDKLEKELMFLKRHEAGFVFTAYEFGDTEAVPTGKVVHVPRKLTYKKALSRTVIFTSTVLFDLEKVDRSLIEMPTIESEDSATWWKILKNGKTAYGLDQPLVIYRRPENSLSSNKKVAVKRIWNLYRKVENKSVVSSAWLMMGWAYRATVRRVIDDTVQRHIGAIRRFGVLQLSLVGLFLYTAVFAAFWFNRLYPILNSVRYNRHGKNLGIGIKFYFRGHILMLLIYFIILVALSHSAGGVKTGYLRPGRVFSCEMIALIITNTITYFQLSFMRNWLLPVLPFVMMTLIQIVLSGIWSYLSDVFYRHVFPAKETLVIDLTPSVETEAENVNEDVFSLKRNAEGIALLLESRSDRFDVIKVMRNAAMGELQAECLRWYDCIVIQGGTDRERRELIEFCNRHYIRVCLVPEIGDLLMQGMGYVDLFDIPMLELKEYSIRWEAAIVKRIADILLGAVGMILCIPVIMANKVRGKQLQSGVYAGKNGRGFKRYWYDSRFGHILDFYNVFRGTMSLAGPIPIRKERSDQLVGQNRWFAYCYRLKPGMTGYAQLNSSGKTTEYEQLKMDVYYSQHFSLINDFKLIIQSLQIRGRSAQ